MAVGSALVGLAAAELALRRLAPQFLTPSAGVFVRDEGRGYRLDPGASHDIVWGGARPYTVVTNRLGQRDAEPSPATEITVLALGDSHTFGVGVQQDETYPARLEALLREKTGRTVDVVNAGVSAYGWLEELDALDEYLESYAVDLILLQTSWNDINDNGIGIPKYLIDGRGRLIQRPGRRRPGGFGPWGMKTAPASRLELFLLERSHVATLVFGSFRAGLFRFREPQIVEAIERRKWDVSIDALDRLVAAARNAQTPLAAVLHPAARPENLDAWGEMRLRVRGMLEQRGIPFVDLTPAIAHRDDATDLYIPGDEHFNASGYVWMADQILPFVERRLRGETP